MIVLRDSQQLTQVVQPDIKAFLRRHFHDIYDTEPYDSDEHGFFILVEPGDTSEQIELDTGYSLLKSMFTDTVYGDSDFMPDFEYLEDHGSFCEAVTVISFKKYLSDQNGSRTDLCDRQQWVVTRHSLFQILPQKYQLTIDTIVTFRIAALQPPRNEAQTQQSQFDAT